ncbi:N-acetylglucosamine-1-phosphate uridyltransferase / Glucosamine-1-phosphate N-acetyltransferase [Thioalkalivibrio nitratireducens DSM 14787]|uniref:Bifunctional protein GlmU n=1 Tax=Thioalkalivibrio nitratireducens (strain DSM 14787 / UNIQEM 213 / ALEN2) TaxID=1255043 RepID=L0E3U3_THIND|nr:bifunctional UDP-N-acetylglucosamine diphosphorylase/glucosamine-1-phosphate N-acetyltransferase GlmU [Thioalkalivibrio nitratireducens]AGA35346.1 N-acetylglucosamine-1-phosphate uridyltransferase / Glucosamine-1-phosphate N-acetyltransferase [Thioalkalivibrio nitratireducens DSM 14787]
MTRPLHVVVLAAGKGTRMCSRLPKVLQPLGGAPLITHVLERARTLAPQSITVVVGHEAPRVRAAAQAADVRFVEQHEQKGTGHAVHLALAGQDPDSRVLVLYGDVPLVPRADLESCLNASAPLTILGAEVDDPSGYGRLIERPPGHLDRIVEERDADPATRSIRRINTGILCAGARDLLRWLAAGEAEAERRRGEWYLTDVVAEARGEDRPVALLMSTRPEAVLGINDRVQLAAQERLLQSSRAERCMREGLHLSDPARFDLRGSLAFGSDCFIDANVILEGDVRLGEAVTIGPGCRLRDVTVADGAVIDAHSLLESCTVGPGCHVGPFARLRPGARLEAGARIGNFVEMKNAVLGPGAKANHLSYIGDASVGARANIGAGTITCNYDGANKHRTDIGADAFIGSNSALVAPVRVGDSATVGAGTVLTRDAPPERLTLARAPQRTLEGWRRPGKRPRTPGKD